MGVNGIRGVGFDLDGTLFDHRGSAEDGLTAFLRSRGGTAPPALVDLWFELEARHFEAWRSGTISFAEQRRARLREFLPALGERTPTTDAALDGVFAEYLQAYRQAWRPFPEAIAVLRSLRESGHATGLLTNGSREQQIDKLTVTGLLPHLDVICVSEDLGVSKPDPRAFARLATAMGVAPQFILFVGDSPAHDIAGARAASMRAALVRRDPPSGSPGGNLEPVFESLTDVVRAHALLPGSGGNHGDVRRACPA